MREKIKQERIKIEKQGFKPSLYKFTPLFTINRMVEDSFRVLRRGLEKAFSLICRIKGQNGNTAVAGHTYAIRNSYSTMKSTKHTALFFFHILALQPFCLVKEQTSPNLYAKHLCKYTRKGNYHQGGNCFATSILYNYT